MAEGMNCEQVRAACVEIFARVTYERIRHAHPSVEPARPWGRREPWEALGSEEKQLWLGVEQRMAPYVDALIEAGLLVPDPVAYAVFGSLSFFTPDKIRDVHLRVTLAEAVEVQEMLAERAAANPRAWPGVEYLIGGIHPLRPVVTE